MRRAPRREHAPTSARPFQAQCNRLPTICKAPWSTAPHAALQPSACAQSPCSQGVLNVQAHAWICSAPALSTNKPDAHSLQNHQPTCVLYTACAAPSCNRPGLPTGCASCHLTKSHYCAGTSRYAGRHRAAVHRAHNSGAERTPVQQGRTVSPAVQRCCFCASRLLLYKLPLPATSTAAAAQAALPGLGRAADGAYRSDCASNRFCTVRLLCTS